MPLTYDRQRRKKKMDRLPPFRWGCIPPAIFHATTDACCVHLHQEQNVNS